MMDLTVVNQSGNNPLLRDYRKGNWTLQETMVLIEAKKMDNERRMKSNNERTGGKPAELRWKWVEDYCWKNGCLRSQNQCNDKWDNLMRDFKKVREYERKLDEESKSYWKIEKNERKDNHLPSSLLPQVYEALVDVVDRKTQRTNAGNGSGSGGGVNVNLQPPPVQQIFPIIHPLPPPLPPVVLPFPQPPPQGVSERPSLPFSQPLPTVDSDDTSEYADSPAKRRKRQSGGDGEGTSGGGGGGGTTLEEVGTAISRSASIIAEAIQSCEEREERRHRELMRLHERRLQIEESKAEINRQGINGLVDAINKLATSIFALATSRNQGPPPT